MNDQTPQQNFYADLKKLKLGEKIYSDKDGGKFKLADLTIDEEEEAQSLLKLSGDGAITASTEDTKKLLSLILEDLNGDKTTLNPGRLLPATAVEVLHDFLLRQSEKGFDLRNFISTSTNGLKKYTKTINGSEDSNQNTSKPN